MGCHAASRGTLTESDSLPAAGRAFLKSESAIGAFHFQWSGRDSSQGTHLSDAVYPG